MRISRRKVLRLTGGILASAPFIHIARPTYAQEPSDPIITPTLRPFGRSIQAGIAIRQQPSTQAEMVRRLKLNEVIAIKGQTTSDASPTTYNTIWYQTDDGYVYSSYIQPVENMTNKPVASVDDQGFWGEVTVPFTEARYAPGVAGIRYYYYYGCIFRVTALQEDADGTPWYRLSEQWSGGGLWVRAEHIRQIPASEFTPLSPDVPIEQKRIDVDVKKQVVTAYEGDKSVFTARVATGAAFRLADGSIQSFRTIPGDHRVFLKSATQHMVGGTAGDSDYYDLPGIGWVSYFTSSGIAFHATYWHNDYGYPRSHGCVNMLPEDAKWVFRWTSPVVPYDPWDLRTKAPTEGTLIRVA
jgi:lipoprotein-anchoring transpeptidase ErfK/SrfK